MQSIVNKTFDEERSLYALKDAEVVHCTFAGPADGESVLKESRDIVVRDSSFSLRYPLWHSKGYRLENSTMDELTRAPIWYAERGVIDHSRITGVKCLRECQDTQVIGSEIHSPEFGWKCDGVKVRDSFIESEYIFLDTKNLDIEELKMKGKYSFQYTENVTIRNSVLDTKDAFWHAKNVTVENSVIKGEYLAWFSDGLTLINCDISGTQPLCYCKNLKLINCRMEGTDLSFEYSDVDATVEGHIISVKNPRSGRIVCDSVGEIVREDPVMECTGEVIVRDQQ